MISSIGIFGSYKKFFHLGLQVVDNQKQNCFLVMSPYYCIQQSLVVWKTLWKPWKLVLALSVWSFFSYCIQATWWYYDWREIVIGGLTWCKMICLTAFLDIMHIICGQGNFTNTFYVFTTSLTLYCLLQCRWVTASNMLAVSNPNDYECIII